jgi:hypothetical protein
MTETMLQDLIKNEPWNLDFKGPQVIISNYLTAFQDYYVAINPMVSQIYNRFQKRNIPVLDLFTFLDRPKDDKNYVLVLDDIYAWLASYFFGSSFNNAAFRLLAAGRKKHTSIIESSVRFKDVDPRLRALHTHLFLPKYSEDAGVISIERFIVDTFEDRPIKPDLYFDAERYFDKYDTEEIIESVYKPSGSHITAQAAMVTKPRPQPPSAPPNYRPQPVLPNSSLTVSPNGYLAAIPKQTSPTAITSEKGRAARLMGIKSQKEIWEQWKEKYPEPDYFVQNNEGTGRGVQLPDIVVYQKGIPVEVVSVKAHKLWPSNERYAPGTKKMIHAVAVTYYRRDLEPEIAMALENKIPCYLVVINARNGNQLIQQIDPVAFESFTTPPWLSEDP